MTADRLGNHTTLRGSMNGRWYEVVDPLYYYTIPPYHLKREFLYIALCVFMLYRAHTQSLLRVLPKAVV
jgi:hypothetical protein